ncbi:DUF4837 family protein [Flavobacteriaceae bacterium TP-CH-4]|uniref:DUF4837 family protein n=1 Tax=Pelagihabitans pacificus TaxID=2696054 RepID=A0A967AS18_9FLAO|nr:DUF4837 family protein [Pelagihabitans pacificus]NHF59064.1 DUF4837 family protein [Pelagihabitans pacificus]
MKLSRTLLLVALIVFFSCKEGKRQDYLPSSIGPINSLAVVMDDALWKGEVGDKVREHFAAPVLALTLNEPKFSINHFPPKSFTGTTRSSRSVLYVMKDTLDIAHIKTDLYATPQKIGVIKGRNNEELIENIEMKADEMINAFKTVEIEEKQKRFLKSLNKEGVMKETFGVSMDIPSIYKVGRQEDNFVWLDRQILKGTSNIIAYTVPADFFKSDSTLVRDIVRMRDSIGELYIPGPDNPGKITHMRTEPAFAPHVFATKIDGKGAVEVRGIWDIKNYPMAGPFLTYIINDEKNDRKMVIEGFVFAPAAEKRDDMFELEAILKTIDLEVGN